MQLTVTRSNCQSSLNAVQGSEVDHKEKSLIIRVTGKVMKFAEPDPVPDPNGEDREPEVPRSVSFVFRRLAIVRFAVCQNNGDSRHVIPGAIFFFYHLVCHIPDCFEGVGVAAAEGDVVDGVC